VAIVGAMLVVGGVLGFFWLAPFQTEWFTNDPNVENVALLMLASFALTCLGVAVYMIANEIQANRLDEEEKT
jgi:hypothetical protein